MLGAGLWRPPLSQSQTCSLGSWGISYRPVPDNIGVRQPAGVSLCCGNRRGLEEGDCWACEGGWCGGWGYGRSKSEILCSTAERVTSVDVGTTPPVNEDIKAQV